MLDFTGLVRFDQILVAQEVKGSEDPLVIGPLGHAMRASASQESVWSVFTVNVGSTFLRVSKCEQDVLLAIWSSKETSPDSDCVPYTACGQWLAYTEIFISPIIHVEPLIPESSTWHGTKAQQTNNLFLMNEGGSNIFLF